MHEVDMALSMPRAVIVADSKIEIVKDEANFSLASGACRAGPTIRVSASAARYSRGIL